VVSVEADGKPLALVTCEEHSQPAIDALVAKLEGDGVSVGELVDHGHLGELPNHGEIGQILSAQFGAVTCPWCLPGQSEHSEGQGGAAV
jgi:hypothetical protein